MPPTLPSYKMDLFYLPSMAGIRPLWLFVPAYGPHLPIGPKAHGKMVPIAGDRARSPDPSILETMTKPQKRERKAPGKYHRSKGGTIAKVVPMRRRNDKGEKQYRLHYKSGQFIVRSAQIWTLALIEDCGGRWLQRRPAGWARLVTPSQFRRGGA